MKRLNGRLYLIQGNHDRFLSAGGMDISRFGWIRPYEELPIPCNMINCFCMYSDYTPLTLDEWIALDAGRRENKRRKTVQDRVPGRTLQKGEIKCSDEK